MRYGSAPDHERVLDFRSGTLRRAHRVDVADRAAACGSGPNGWSRSPSARSPRSTTRSSRSTGTAARRAVRPAGQRADRSPRPTTRGRRPRWTRRWSPTSLPPENYTGGARAPHPQLRAAHGRRDGPRARRTPTGVQHRDRGGGDLARLTVAVDVPPGRAAAADKYLAYGWSSQRSAPALRAQVEAALAGAPADRLGRPAGRSSAPTSTTSGSRRTSSSTATPNCSRRCGSRCSTSCRPVPAARRGRSRPRA